MGRVFSTHWRDDECIQVSVGKPGNSRLLERPRRNWEDNIKMDLAEIGWGAVNYEYINLAQNMNHIEQAADVVTSLSLIRDLSGSNLGRDTIILTEVSHDFPQSTQENIATVSQIRPRPLPHELFPIQYALIILPLMLYSVRVIQVTTKK